MAKILVADDNSNIQKMVGLALKDQGIDVVAVGNGEAAVRKISDLKPDLVLADVFMPVRNGYEVCKYVKEDSSLSHIPVILLVGAFDPLDEQEAQRVGADGVLKKPFVPPDPLISMVKSALARAGVPLGNVPAPEKATELPRRSAADLLGNAASKLAALSANRPPEVEPEPVLENFATLPPQVSIPEGSEPLAFGSLLETPEIEDESIFVPAKPPTDLGTAHDWGKDGSEDEEITEEEEEASSGNGWRPSGDLDQPSLAAMDAADIESRVKDWREAAFHGSSPARPSTSEGWAPAVDEPVHAEAASTQSVGVSTLEAVKPIEVPAFSGDAWAAAMAAGMDEKTVEPVQEIAKTREVASTTAAAEITEVPAVTEKQPEQPVAPESSRSSTTDNGWYSVTASPWDIEAKKATLLASTWDSKPAEEPAISAAEHTAAEEFVEAVVPQIHEEIREAVQHVVSEPEEAPSAYARIEEVVQEREVAPVDTSAHSEHVPANPNETQEIESYQPAESKSWGSSWVAAPAEVVNQFVGASRQEFAESALADDIKAFAREVQTEAVYEPAPELTHVEPEHAAEPVIDHVPEVAHEPTTRTEPNLDELVARVLSRLNPDVLHRVTQEILKPVIEALVKDELNTKKQ